MFDSASPNLKSLHTFHLDVACKRLIEITSVEQLKQHISENDAAPTLILGRGSNVLFTQDFDGTVLLNRIMGVSIEHQQEQIFIRAGGGEDWPTLVESMVSQGVSGFENLAMIPGCVGSAPIQNIGAYGVELEALCQYVEYLELATGELKTLTKEECRFGYRDSIFKHELKDKVFITAVGFVVPKQWQPKIGYGALKAVLAGEITPKAVFDAVCAVRQSKLPDPDIIGNAGSFFKNPVVDKATHQQLLERFPDVVGYSTEDGVKLAAGWLIDKAGLKGTVLGGAQVHPDQALVLTNKGEALPQDIVLLAEKVRTTVFDTFGVSLEHEVRFMDAQRETNLEEAVAKL